MASLILLPESPERDLRELEFWRSIVSMLQITTWYAAPETIQATERAVALAEKSGNLRQLADWMMSKGLATWNSGNLPAAGALADQALDLALREGGATIRGRAYMLQICTRYWRGDLAGARSISQQGSSFSTTQASDGAVRS